MEIRIKNKKDYKKTVDIINKLERENVDEDSEEYKKLCELLDDIRVYEYFLDNRRLMLRKLFIVGMFGFFVWTVFLILLFN